MMGSLRYLAKCFRCFDSTTVNIGLSIMWTFYDSGCLHDPIQ